ncbi:MAG: hypothetical protein A2X13_06110 [Bacteroidetes bacterium GWC2_33_15]|nr:MAG: hypothetical protein A2X10_03650 [Bacteroidetes bacterium GWA2_33_15]OFX51797.1 MAG: hypothetical protein A2X13_06110 [Bacteroidetes bacterium GWC2_33_15]OFX66831.1 MAG: hypothetical protein A2X15_09015 [Bacteroidetes bacterium GWB2_32_14]OFX67089.1 MAG: hypothetical protein A2X14_10520 [Bacteroidetes bacterium GWD2_33_33]HAN17179.1 hypothetical protein [Bacteroidales bacterium]
MKYDLMLFKFHLPLAGVQEVDSSFFFKLNKCKLYYKPVSSTSGLTLIFLLGIFSLLSDKKYR